MENISRNESGPRAVMTPLIAARHMVGFLLFMLCQRPVVLGQDRVLSWLGGVIGCVTIAAVITGLAALFFTKTQAKHSAENFVYAIWLFGGLILFEQWFGWASLR